MNKHPISRSVLIGSLVLLKEELQLQKLPKKVIKACLEENPWFTKYYVKRSLEGIRSWLEEEILLAFLSAYSEPESSPLKVAVIAAGNVPLVCFHDVLCTLFSGNICLLKPSHQDRVLITYLRELWIKILPEIQDYFQLLDRVKHADFLISTGSNNTARYIASLYEHIPKLIRKNRFSVGILKKGLSEQDMLGLAEDIFLYNGLGCRNVSNILIFPEADVKSFFKILDEYPKNLLNPLYLERVLYERGKLELLGENLQASRNILLRNSSSFSFTSMGLIQGVKIRQKEEKELGILEMYQSEIQVIVGLTTDYGKAQLPALKDFADEIDTLKLLSALSSPQAKLFDEN